MASGGGGGDWTNRMVDAMKGGTVGGARRAMERGSAAISKAIAKDNAGEYQAALRLYREGLKDMLHALKHTNDPELKRQLGKRCEGYMQRAEVLRGVAASADVEQQAAAEAAAAVTHLPTPPSAAPATNGGGGDRGDSGLSANSSAIQGAVGMQRGAGGAFTARATAWLRRIAELQRAGRVTPLQKANLKERLLGLAFGVGAGAQAGAAACAVTAGGGAALALPEPHAGDVRAFDLAMSKYVRQALDGVLVFQDTGR